MNKSRIIAVMIALTMFSSPVLASEAIGTLTTTSQIEVTTSSGSGGGGSVGGQYMRATQNNSLLEMQITILKLKIEIMKVLLQLKLMGRTIPNIQF